MKSSFVERSKCRCTVKAYASGLPFIVFEPLAGEQPRAIRGKHISIDLRPGTTLGLAQALARELNKNIIGLAISDE
jgi:cell wall assembly regulator SMI1